MVVELGLFMVYYYEIFLIVNVLWMVMIIINYFFKLNKWYLINN